nr:hypothetical protein [Tanacetum cinerariifolium]
MLKVLLDHLLAHRMWLLFLLTTLAVLIKLILLLVFLLLLDITHKRKALHHDLMYSLFTNQSSGPQLDHEDLKQVDEFDLEEMDLKWLVAMISTRLKKFYKKTKRKLHFDIKKGIKTVEGDVGNTRYKARDNEKRPAKQDEHKAMVTIDGEGVDWTGYAEDDTEDHALMAFNSSHLGSDTEVTSCSKVCEESYAKLK